MTTAEIVSIIALCTSAITAISSAVIPSILSYKAKKEDLAERRKLEAEKREHELQQEYEAKFEVFYQSHLNVLTEFTELYVQWKHDNCRANARKLVVFVNKLSKQYRDNIETVLHDFQTKIVNFEEDDNLDEDYTSCLNLILKSYGVTPSWQTENILMSDLLKIALREQFAKLENSSTSSMHFHSV